MKFVAFLIIALFTVCVRSQDAVIMKIIQDCKASSGATDEDVGKLMLHQPPSNDQQKCLVACIFETEGMVRN